MKLAVIACLFGMLAIGFAINPSPPQWGAGDTFHVRVNFTNPKPVGKWDLHYYHFANSTVVASRYEHSPPQFDEMCKEQPYGSDHQCNVIFAVNGWSYIQFPGTEQCCRCENQFGAVKTDWLAGGEYIGQETVRNYTCDHWEVQGQYLNHVYARQDDQYTVRFNELWGIGHTLKQWDFVMDSYVVGPFSFDLALVQPPPNCDGLCENWCSRFRV